MCYDANNNNYQQSPGPVDGGKMRILSLGLTWWLTPVFNTSVNFRDIRLDRYGIVGHSAGINLRLTLMLE